MHDSAVPTAEERDSVNPQLDPVSVHVRDAAKLIGVSERTAWEMVKSRELASFKRGSRRLVLYTSCREWAEQAAAADRDRRTILTAS